MAILPSATVSLCNTRIWFDFDVSTETCYWDGTIMTISHEFAIYIRWKMFHYAFFIRPPTTPKTPHKQTGFNVKLNYSSNSQFVLRVASYNIPADSLPRLTRITKGAFCRLCRWNISRTRTVIFSFPCMVNQTIFFIFFCTCQWHWNTPWREDVQFCTI